MFRVIYSKLRNTSNAKIKKANFTFEANYFNSSRGNANERKT